MGDYLILSVSGWQNVQGWKLGDSCRKRIPCACISSFKVVGSFDLVFRVTAKTLVVNIYEVGTQSQRDRLFDAKERPN